MITNDVQISRNDKCGYSHYMLKEIMEQPDVLQDSLTRGIVNLGRGQLSPDYSDLELGKYQKLIVIACGTAYHAGLVGKHFMERIARVPVAVELASEFRYNDSLVDPQTLAIVISQSGETGDTVAALREAKFKGGRIVAITNVIGSTIAREADDVIYTVAGVEVSVASTKAYMAQLVTLYLLGIQLALDKKTISAIEAVRYLEGLTQLPQLLDKVLVESNIVQTLAERLAKNNGAFYLGRGIDTPVVMEGSLKLKETSYIHAEAYSAGEFRHGPIALIEEGIPTIILATQPELARKTIEVVEELKARGAWMIGITMADTRSFARLCDGNMILPTTLPEFTPILGIVPLQLLAYHTACARGTDVDNPRNLVKSVKDTVSMKVVG